MKFRKFKKLSDDELYITKRAFIEASFNIVMEGKYNYDEIELYNKLSNEIIEEIKYRNGQT